MHTIAAAECDHDEWNRFACEHGWFWHTSLWHDYTVQYASATNPRSAAFAVVDGTELVAIAPAIIEQTNSSGASISFGGGPTWAPAVHGGLEAYARAAALDKCLQRLEQIADDAGRAELRLQLSPLVSTFPERALEFAGATTRRGYRDLSLTTAVLDLAGSEDALLRAMSKGHRSAIRRGHHIATRVATDDASFATYRELHRRAAGRTTRPSTTFELMRGWLEMGYAAVVLAEIGGEPVGASLLLICRDGAYTHLPQRHLSIGAT